MKKIFMFAIVFAAAAMISCAGNANQAQAEEAAVECCGECTGENTECEKAECACEKAEAAEEVTAEATEVAAEQKAE